MLWNNLVRCFQKKGSVKKYDYGCLEFFTPFFQVMSNPIGEGPRSCDWSNQSNRMLRRYIYCIYTVSKLKIKKKKKSTESILEKKITFIRKQSTKKTTTMTTWIIPGRLWSSEIRHPRRWGDWASWACPSLRRRCYPEVTSSRMG